MCKYLVKVVVCCALSFVLFPACAANKQVLYVGVLEDRSDMHMRLAFQKTGQGWAAVFPPGRELASPGDCQAGGVVGRGVWTVLFQGAARGTFGEVREIEIEKCHQLGMFQLWPKILLRTAGIPPKELIGWRGKVLYRPLLVTSGKWAGDPEGWQEAEAPEQVVALAKDRFREIRGIGEEKRVVVYQSIRSQAGTFLVGLRLDPDQEEQEGPRDQSWSTFWLRVTGGEVRGPLAVQYRNSDNMAEVTFLDAADLDGDGRSELLFFLASYNEDGYVLARSDLSMSETFSWSYH